MKDDKKWISFAQAKLMQELYKQEEDRWWQQQFYGRTFTDEEWSKFMRGEEAEYTQEIREAGNKWPE